MIKSNIRAVKNTIKPINGIKECMKITYQIPPNLTFFLSSSKETTHFPYSKLTNMLSMKLGYLMIMFLKDLTFIQHKEKFEIAFFKK